MTKNNAVVIIISGYSTEYFYFLKVKVVFILKKAYIKITVILVICVLAEILLSNRSAIAVKLGGYETVDLNFEDAALIDADKETSIKDNTLTIDTGKLRFENLNTEIRNICIETGTGIYRYKDVSVAFTDDNFAFDEGFDYNGNTYTIYMGDHEKNYINVASYGKVKTLDISFNSSSGESSEITSIKINAPPEFDFSLFRFAVMLFTCAVIGLGAWKWKTGKNDYSLILFSTAIICIVLAAIMMFALKCTDQTLLDEYPLENEYTMDQYQQLFNSFHNGRLDINVEHDPEEFGKLTNPYDISERSQTNLSGDYWDRAYYNGKFYSYFGAAPVLTVYYPVYILTRSLPSSILASTIITIYAIIFLSLLYIVILKRFCKDVPIVTALMGHLALIFGSSVLTMNTEQLFYYIAVISGIGALAAFLYFLLKAYFEENTKKKAVFLVLTGVSVVLIAASRPTMLIYCTAAIVPAVYVFGSKNETLKNKVLYACSVSVPVVLGAAVLMIYNYLRFANPFEFGFSYQLTVSVADANTLTLAYIPAAIYHYFFQQPVFKSRFPFVEMNASTLSVYPRYTFTMATIGVFSYPAAWGIWFFPITDKKENKFKSFFMSTLLVSAILLSFIDMCKAGSHYRYTADILLPILIVALVTMFDLLHMLRNAKPRIYATAYIFIILAMAATVVLGYLLTFSNENGYYMYDYAAVTQVLREI